MKNKGILSFVLLAALAAAGCSDFLDIKPKGKDVPQTVAHYNGLFNNMIMMNMGYYQLLDNGSTRMVEPNLYYPYMSDEVTVDATAFSNMGVIPRLAYTWQDDIFVDDAYSAEFGACYEQIYFCNMVVNEVLDATEGTPAEKRQLHAEARAMRAYLHFMLAQWFGKPYNAATAATDPCIPIVTQAHATASDFKRASVKEVYEFVIRELEEACPQLKEATGHRLRTYQPAGYIYLGRAYMFMGDFAKANTAFAKADAAILKSEISLGLYDYNTKVTTWGYNAFMPYFWTSGYPNPFAADNIEVVQCKQFLLNQYWFYQAPTLYIKDEYMAFYDAQDHRRKFFANQSMTGPLPHYRKQSVRINANIGAEIPDLYLMHAECLARENKLAEARALVTKLRENRMPASVAPIPDTVVTKDDLVRFIVEERLREYMGLGHRWFDVRRLWNDPLFQGMKANYTHTDGTNTYTLTEKRLTYRIPSKVMAHNPGWVNNE